MFSEFMSWIYIGISWILLRWHDFWDLVLPGDATFLATNWDWILAIVFLVITVRIVLFPIFVKQIRSQRAMQALQPKMKELQEKYKGDKEAQRREMMKLYQTEKVNPLMGCLPMFLQIPVFLGLFHVLKHLNPFGPNGQPMDVPGKELYGWSITQFDSAAKARLFDAPIPAHFSSSVGDLLALDANGLVVKVVAGVLVLIMMATTFLTSRQMILKTGWSQEPQQRMVQKLMLYGIPLTLLLSGWYFPIGVIIYWVTQNLFSLGQQHWVLHKYPPPVTAGSIPMKSARKNGEEAPRGALARFFAPREEPTKAASNGSRFVNPAQPAGGRTGLFRRRTEPAEQAPAVEPRSLAPRPGAKPTNPKQANVEPKPSASSPSPKPTSVDPKPAVPPSDDEATPAQPTSSDNGAAKPGGTKSGGDTRSGGGRSGGASKSATARKSTTPRKGPANKKGGPRR
jgi:YidC/Oxa1 family membrane protein insertase